MFIRKISCALAFVASLASAGATHAALLGLAPADPTIDLAAGSVVAFNASARVVTISGTPQLLQQLSPFVFAEFIGTAVGDEKFITIQFKVDGAGNFLSGVDGPDLIIKGAIDIDGDGTPDFDGVLLEAEVSQFGFENGAPGANDFFDLRLTPSAGLIQHLFNGRDLAVTVQSEPSVDYPNPFNGGWAVDFVGQAKALLGSIDPVVVGSPCSLKVESFCSVQGNANKEVCRIQVTKSPMHWEHHTCSRGGHEFKVFKYGLHGGSMPAWASRYRSTPVKFTYVVTNTGTTPISNLQVMDSFDTDPTGVPTMLQPGQQFTVVRTEHLRDGLVN